MAQWVIGALGIFQFAGKTEEGHVHHCPLRLFGIPARLLTSVHSTNQLEAVQPHSMLSMQCLHQDIACIEGVQSLLTHHTRIGYTSLL